MSDEDNAPFNNANALIFGGAKGIGKAVALEWAHRGAKLAIADLDTEASGETAEAINAVGGTAIDLPVNVLDDDSVIAASEAATEALGEIDIVMNNVGGMLNGHPEDIPMAEWQRIMEINYFAAVRGVQHFMPLFIERGHGHIVNTASFAGLYPYAASRVPYAAAKAAVISMSENLAIYLEPLGVRVSCLIPGPVLTGVLDSMTSWTDECAMRGPGRETTLLLPDQVAKTLADGMRDGRVLIPSDDIAFDIIRRHSTSPDDFIRDKIAEFAAGEDGRPAVPEAIINAMTGKQ